MAAAVVLVAVAAVALLARRRVSGPTGLVLEARLPLGRDAGVALVRAGGERLLLGWGGGGVRLLARLREEGAP
jgi:flagellar biogenesis protein FliO